jgi:beta-N-acetylhexosaminidase
MTEEQALKNGIAKFIGEILFIVAFTVGVPAHTQTQLMASDDEAVKWADATLAKLTLEQKIGQIICAEIAGGYITDDDPKLAKWLQLARDYGVGGFVLYGGTPLDVARLLNRLQKAAALPILMAADFEGGPGQQITGASEFPANLALAAIGSEALVYEVAKLGAREGRAMGIHLTYTPVVDISMRPENPAESVRSFGGDLELLGKMVGAYVRGYQENGMLTTAKHFPGRGDVERMPTHPDFSYLNKSAQEVEEQEFRAFKKAIDAGVTFVMSEHIAVPSVTEGSELPASVEKKLATGWLRDKLGFKGILTTDDLWYEHVTKRFGPVQVAVKAVQAGHDVILKPADAMATIQGLAAAVKAGEISETPINHSVRKLLYWKARLNLHKNRFVDEHKVSAVVGSKAHLALVQEVADKSLTLLKNDGVLPAQTSGSQKLVNICIQKLENDPSPAALATKLAAALPGIKNFTLRPDTDPALYDKAMQAAHEADLVIFSLFVQRTRLGEAAPLRERDQEFINGVVAAKPKAVLAMSYGNPHLIRKIGEVPAFLVGYGERGWFGNQAVYFDSFIKVLKGEIKPAGKLPVKVSDQYRIGSGLGY